MSFISLIVASDLFGDNVGHFATMMEPMIKTNSKYAYILLAFFTTISNFTVACAIFYINVASNDIQDIFKNFAGLIIVTQMDNKIAEFIKLHVKESDDDDFLEIPLQQSVEDNANLIRKTQTYIYVILNILVFHLIKKVQGDGD